MGVKTYTRPQIYHVSSTIQYVLTTTAVHDITFKPTSNANIILDVSSTNDIFYPFNKTKLLSNKFLISS